MHDLNLIRENPSSFDESLKKRFLEPQSSIILDLSYLGSLKLVVTIFLSEQ